MKKFLKGVGYALLSLIALLIILFLCGEISTQYKYNHQYSIAMPKIIGEFEVRNNSVTIFGVEKSLNDELMSLRINETKCYSNICQEKRAVISGIGGNGVYPYYKEYKIKYADKNKIIFGDAIGIFTGEIDLNAKTLIHTIRYDNLKNGFEKIEVITDNKEIKKLEKQIIRKYLKRKWFK